MKHTLFILALITASIQTFAQSPRIKLNQITKDSLTGSVLISSPTDSGMVYSRDLFISYGADTVLILGGDTLAATSSIISSVLSDGVTITGDGTTGSELTVDTATVIATKGDLSDYVTIAGTETITGAKTFSTAIVVNENGDNVDTRFEGDTYANLLFLDASADRVGIGTSSPATKLETYRLETVNRTNYTDILTINADANNIPFNGHGGGILFRGATYRGKYNYGRIGMELTDLSNLTTGENMFFEVASTDTTNTLTRAMTIRYDGDVGIGTTTPQAKLDVEGGVRAALLTSEKQVIASSTLTDPTTDSTLTNGTVYSLNGVSNTNNFGIGLGAIRNNKYDIWFQTGSINGGGYRFYRGTSEIVTITNSGDVGIGETSPSEALEVNGNILASGTITPNGSDRKLKTNISTLNSGLDVISNLIPVTYDFIQNTDKKFPIYNQVGFVAQDVQDALSGKSYINGIVIETKDYLALDYDKFSPIIVKAIQEQQTIIKSQASEIETLKTLIKELSNRLTILENN